MFLRKRELESGKVAIIIIGLERRWCWKTTSVVSLNFPLLNGCPSILQSWEVKAISREFPFDLKRKLLKWLSIME